MSPRSRLDRLRYPRARCRGFIFRNIARVISFGAFAPGNSTAPISKSQSGINSMQVRLARIKRVRKLSIARSRKRKRSTSTSRIVTSAPQTGCHARGVHARGPTSNYNDASRQNSRHAAEQHSAATIVFRQKIRAHHHRHPAGDLAHRFEQRQAIVDLDRFIGNPRSRPISATLR